MEAEWTPDALTKERKFFLIGSAATIVGIPLASLLLLHALVAGGSALLIHWNTVIYPTLMTVMHLSVIYLTWRLSRFLRNPWWLTLVYCGLSVYWIYLYLIPFVALLVAVSRTRRRICEEERDRISRELEVFLAVDRDFDEIIDWMAARGWWLVAGDDVLPLLRVPELHEAAGVRVPGLHGDADGEGSYDFAKPGCGSGFRIGKGRDSRPPIGRRVGDVHFAAPSEAVQAKIHSDRGTELLEEGALEDAIPEFQAALAVMPRLAVTRNNLGLAFVRTGKLDEAIVQFREATRIKPEYADAYANLGAAYFDQRDLTEAQAALREALRLEPHSARAHFNLAVVLGRSGRFGQARAELLRVLELDPVDHRAREYLEDLERISRRR